jgi:hypothetical protein
MASIITKVLQGYTITAADTANYLQIGSAGHGNTGGAILIEFVPDSHGSWNGSFVIVARVGGGPLGKQEAAIGVPFAQVPYRQIYLNGVVADYSIVSTVITGASIIQVPCAGLSIALLPTVVAGFGTIYYRMLEETCAP